MTFIERLQATEAPYHRRKTLGGPLGQLVARYMDDMTEARERGYSWTQICKMVKTMAKEAGEWNEHWNLGQIENQYRRFKKGESFNG